MKSGMPWSTKQGSSDNSLRSSDAAHRAGMTLGEWLNTMITDEVSQPNAEAGSSAATISAERTAHQMSLPPHQRSDTSVRLEDIAQQLNHLARRDGGNDTPPKTRKPSKDDDSAGTMSANMRGDMGLERVLQRVETNERHTLEALTAVNDRLLGLSAQVTTRNTQQPQVEPAALLSLEKAVRSIVDHIEISDRQSKENIQSLQQRLTMLSNAGDAGQHKTLHAQAIASLDERLDELSSRVSSKQADAAGLDHLRHDLGRLAERVEAVRTAGEQLAARAQNQAVQTSQRELHEIEGRILGVLKEAQSAFASQGSSAIEVQKLRNEISALNQRIDQLRNNPAVDREVANLRGVVDQLQAKVQQGPDMRPYMDLDRRMSDLTHRVEQQAQRPHGIADLEGRLAEMDGRMRDLSRVQNEPRVNASLDRKLTEIAERLNRTEGQFGHIETIERAVNQLFESVDHNRSWAREAAEDAANRMAQRLMADMASTATTTAPAAANHSAELRALEEGLRATRENAMNADQRNQETLAAVHETLEHIISKIAELETATIGQRIAQAAIAAEPVQMPEPLPEAWSAAEPQLSQLAALNDLALSGPDAHQPSAPTYQPHFAEQNPVQQTEWQPDHSSQPQAAPVPPYSASTGTDDYILAARRAAMAASQGAALGSLQPKSLEPAKSKGLMKFLSRGRKAAKDAPTMGLTGVMPTALAEQALSPKRLPPRLTLIMAGMLLLAAVGAFYISNQNAAQVAVETTTAAQKPETQNGAQPAAGAQTPTQAKPQGETSGNGVERPQQITPQNPATPAEGARPNQPQAQLDSGNNASGDEILTGSVNQAPSKNEMPPPETGNQALRLAARDGNATAQFIVATRMFDASNGEGNLDMAAHWYEKSAQAGFAPAQYRLATLYERGHGVQKNMATALSLYKSAAEQGNVRSMHNVAVLSAGNEAAAPDYNQAFHWFLAASQHGLKDSQFNVALLYDRGLGVPKNAGEALFWYTVAAANGDGDAAKRAQALKGSLPPATVKAVTAKAAAWKPQPAIENANIVTVNNPAWNDKHAALKTTGQRSLSQLETYDALPSAIKLSAADPVLSQSVGFSAPKRKAQPVAAWSLLSNSES